MQTTNTYEICFSVIFMNYLSLIKLNFQIVTTRCLIIALGRYIWIFFFPYDNFLQSFKSDVSQNSTKKWKEIKPSWRTVQNKVLSPACKREIRINISQHTIHDSYQILTMKQGKSIFAEVVSFCSSAYCHTIIFHTIERITEIQNMYFKTAVNVDRIVKAAGAKVLL